MAIDFENDILNAVETLNKGGVILYPTDTVWGIGCDSTNAEAINRVCEIKKRNNTTGMLVLMDNPDLIPAYVDEVPEIAWSLIDIADKPTTIIYPGAKGFPKNLIASDGSIGIRITSELFTCNLIKQFKKPIVSTSANISGKPAPGNYNQIDDIIKAKVDYIVKYKQDEEIPAPKPSSILRLGVGGQIEIIRE